MKPQPISTAPKGRLILLFFPPPGIGVWATGSWSGDGWEAAGPTTGFAGHPLHWMECPPTPGLEGSLHMTSTNNRQTLLYASIAIAALIVIALAAFWR